MTTSTQSSNIRTNVAISIVENKCISFRLIDYQKKSKSEFAFSLYEFGFAINFSLVAPLQQVKVILSIKLFGKSDENENIELAELKSSNTFVVLNFEQVFQKHPTTGQSLVPNKIMELLNEIAIGNARGMFSIKLENTFFSNAVLPLIDPKMLSVTPTIPLA